MRPLIDSWAVVSSAKFISRPVDEAMNVAGRAGIAVSLQTYIREVLGSNLDQDSRYPGEGLFMVFFSPWSQIPT
jgi:hypothetical protein